jgi:hypothetical protein
MGTVDNNPIAVVKKKRPDLAAKRQQNKQDLVNELIWQMKSNIYEWEDYLLQLAEEALLKRSQKDLKEILYGE